MPYVTHPFFNHSYAYRLQRIYNRNGMRKGWIMKIDGVFSGGGVKAYAFIGALEALDHEGYTFERVAGSSAGAIVASFLAANYTIEEIKTLMEDVSLIQFLDPPVWTRRIPFSKWISLYFQMGLYKGDRFETWLQQLLVEKGVRTFADIAEGSLKIVVSDVTLGRLVVIPDDLYRLYQINPATFSIATAVRMSASFPYFFMPKKLQNDNGKISYIVDGGLLSNFPLWIFRKEKRRDVRPVIGISLSESIEHGKEYRIRNSLDLLQALFHSMLSAHDTRYIEKSKQDNIVFIPIKKIKTTDFTLTDEQKQTLIELGNTETKAFLRHWP